MSWFTIDPDAVLDFAQDWTAWLTDGETITAHTATGTHITVDSSAVVAGVVTVWVSGAEKDATITVHVTTSAGREDDRTIGFHVNER